MTLTPGGHYQYLTESFLSKRLSLLIAPPPEYLQLNNPYDFLQFRGLKLDDGTYLKNRLYDVSFYDGKFYLYFGPLPVIFFYLPFKLLTGYYPPTSFAVFFFLSIGFLTLYLLLIQIKEKYFQHISDMQLMRTGFVLGLSWQLTILIARSSHYEAAIASAFCLMSIALFFPYKAFANNLKAQYVFLSSLCLSLSVAGRPHFAIICLVFLPALLIYFFKFLEKKRLSSVCSALILPAIFVGSLLGLYNYLRFDSIFEFGQKYQLLGGDTHGQYIGLFQFDNILSNIGLGFYNYFFRP